MDNTCPEVTVIIAAYNVQNYIERAVHSALSQKPIRVEVIIVDDASTDKTVAMAARISDPRVRIIKRITNGGPGAARNEGLAAATAPWIAILDGDDAFAPQRLHQCLIRAQNLNADIVVDNLDVTREADGTHFLMFRPGDFGTAPTLELAAFIYGNSSFMGGTSLGYVKPLFSTAFLRQHRLSYDTSMPIGEDYLLMAEALALRGRCAINPSAGYIYTVRAGSTSHRITCDDLMKIRKADRKFLSQYPLEAAARNAQKKRNRRLVQAYFFTRLVSALKQRRLVAALKLMAKHPISISPLWRPLWARLRFKIT
jgi:succinoglycan biosynthesis protein ExoO